MKHLIMTVNEFNKIQNDAYLSYFTKCIDSLIAPLPQSSIYPICEHKSGYVLPTVHNSFMWRKTKKAILAFHGIN